MEMASVRWLSELGMEDSSFIQNCDMSSLDHFTTQQIAAALGEEFQNTFSPESYSSYPPNLPLLRTTGTNLNCSSVEAASPADGGNRPLKQLRTCSSWNSGATDHLSTTDASPPNFLSFGSHRNSSSPAANNQQQFCRNLIAGAAAATAAAAKPKDESLSPGNSSIPAEMLISHQGSFLNQGYLSKAGQGGKAVKIAAAAAASRPPSHTQDHIIAERKRREKLSQRFIALSAIVPGLKKMDKASVLGDAIKYVKQLQERVQVLEEQTLKKTMESVVFVKKSQLCGDDDLSSSGENFDGHLGEPLPEIEARVSNRNILIRVHCEKRKGTLVKTLEEIEMLHLSVVSTSVIPFANSALDITITAQMEEDFCMSTKDVVKYLRSAFSKFM